MSRRFFAAGLNRLSTKSHIATSQSRAELSQRKSERFEQHRLAILQRRAAQQEHDFNAFKRADAAFRLCWLMSLGVMKDVVRLIRKIQPLAIQRAPESRRRSVAPHAAYAVEHLESRQLLTVGAVDLSYGNIGVMQLPMGAFESRHRPNWRAAYVSALMCWSELYCTGK